MSLSVMVGRVNDIHYLIVFFTFGWDYRYSSITWQISDRIVWSNLDFMAKFNKYC